jgi:DnaJ-class molecular chaperone
MVKDTTLYDRLQIPTDATDSHINKAFHKLSKQWHPDKHQEQEQKEEASKKFQEIQQAKEILLDEQKRQLYDQIGMAILEHNPDPHDGGFPFGGMPGFPFGGMPGFPFGGMPGGMHPEQEQGEPIVYELSVTLDQVYNEKTVTIQYPCFYTCTSCHGEGTATGKPNLCGACNGQGRRMQIMRMGNMIQQSIVECDQCRGKGKVIELSNACRDCLGEGKVTKQKERSVKLLPGLETGNKIQLQGKGHHLKYGSRSDLIIVVTVDTHPIYKRYQNDLFTVVPLTLYQALFGYTIHIKHLDGRFIRLTCTSRTEPDTVQCLPYHGMRHEHETGKLFLLFQLRLPELPVIPECKPLLQSLDPSAVACEQQALHEKADHQHPMAYDATPIQSVYYQLMQQEKNPRPKQHRSAQQPGCVQQ